MQRAASEWLDGRVARGEIGTQTARVQMARLNSLITSHGGRPREELDYKGILAWMASIGTYKPATRRLYVSTVSSFTKWMVAEGYLDTDPCISIPKVREPRTVPRALSESDVAALLCAAPTVRMYAVLWLMVGCGLRCVEVSRLDLLDWDRDAQKITVRGKAGHERVLPLPTPVRLALEVYVDSDRGPRPGPLIGGVGSKSAPDGRLSPGWLSQKVAKTMSDAGLHAPGDGRTAHALRHTCASDVLERCHDVRLVQELLGHASLATTQRYLRRASLEQLREAMEGRTYGVLARGDPSVPVGVLRGAASPGAVSPEAGDPTEGHRHLQFGLIRNAETSHERGVVA